MRRFLNLFKSTPDGRWTIGSKNSYTPKYKIRTKVAMKDSYLLATVSRIWWQYDRYFRFYIAKQVWIQKYIHPFNVALLFRNHIRIFCINIWLVRRFLEFSIFYSIESILNKVDILSQEIYIYLYIYIYLESRVGLHIWSLWNHLVSVN